MTSSSRKIPRLLQVLFVLGMGLLALNLVGLGIPLRSTSVTEDYADFARDSTLSFDDAMARLEALDSPNRKEFITEATRTFHYGMAHIPTQEIAANGLDHYRMRVPAWENFVLYALSFLKPDTYMDYEFCSYRKALERGTGRCGQQALALVGFLSSKGVDTGFVRLGGHAIATAAVNENEWYLLDPDYGGVIPFDIFEAEKNPERVIDYYWNDAVRSRDMYKSFGPRENGVSYGGPEARWARVCPIEKVAYTIKWLLPFLLIIPLVVFASMGIRRAANQA